MTDKRIGLRRLSFFMILHVLGAALILAAARQVMFHNFGEDGLWARASADLARLWNVGLRFDLRAAAMAAAPLYLLGLIGLGGRKTSALFFSFQKYYTPLVFFVTAAAAFVNYYYFRTFHRPIDIFIFGLANDDTAAVIQSIYDDYPFVRVILAGLLITLLASWPLRRFITKESRKPGAPIASAVIGLIVLTLFAAAARGSLGTFPLRQADSQVSEIDFINRLAPNGIFAMDWAISEYRKSGRFEPVDAAEGPRLMARAGVPKLDFKTPENAYLAENPPHVVLAVMESFGSNMLSTDDPRRRDLLGNLRPHFETDMVFRRFLPAANGTAPSLAFLLFESSEQTISQGVARNVKLTGTAMEPFKNKGYRVVFITGGNLGWRNLANYLKIQGVDEVYDQNSLIKAYPEAEKDMTSWGAPDEYAFRLAETILNAAAVPHFVIILSISNHPPFRAPAHYRARPINDVRQDEEYAALEAFQYAASSLGDFMSAIKGGPLAGRCVLAATGDHQMRQVSVPSGGAFLDKAVPLYLYAPQAVWDSAPRLYDAARPGSHKDVLPTLYALSLSNADYYSVGGRDLVAPKDAPELAFGYNVDLWLEPGAVFTPGSSCRYPFADQWLLKNDCLPAEPGEVDRMKAFGELLRWQLERRVAGIL